MICGALRFLKSSEANKWVGGALCGGIAGISVAIIVTDHTEEQQHHACHHIDHLYDKNSLLISSRRQHTVQCEAVLPYQRVNNNDMSSSKKGGGVGNAEPWQSVLSSRKSISKVKKQKMNMYRRYDVDFETVLGEGVSLVLHTAAHLMHISHIIYDTFVLQIKAYGQVYPARLIETGENLALKKISKRYTNSTSFNKETDALLRIYENGGHPNISGLRDMYEDSG